MGVIALQEHIDGDKSGEILGLALVALRYVGDRSSVATRGALASQGRWPGTSPLNNGVWYFALVPDEGLPYLENRDDLELVYADDREAFAEALLEKSRLPDNLFGNGANQELKSRVDEALGLESPMQAGPYHEQLQAIAGVEDDDVDEADAERSERVTALVEGNSRDDLKEVVKEVRDDADEFSLRGAGVTEMAEWLADQDDSEVNAALGDSEGDN